MGVGGSESHGKAEFVRWCEIVQRRACRRWGRGKQKKDAEGTLGNDIE